MTRCSHLLSIVNNCFRCPAFQRYLAAFAPSQARRRTNKGNHPGSQETPPLIGLWAWEKQTMESFARSDD